MSNAPLFDIGLNLTNPRLLSRFDEVMQRAMETGVCGALVTGTDIEESVTAIPLCEQYPQQLFSTAGIHPHYAKDAPPDFVSQLKQLVQNPVVKAIGECGLDFNRNFSPKEKQLAVFEAQLELAVETGLPVFLHERDAFDEQITLLKRYRDKLVGGVAHCFTGSLKQMQAYLELDLYIGITGWLCDDKRGADLQEAVQHLPLSRLLLETDAPYLAPKTLKPKVSLNEPCYLAEVARYYAQLCNVSVEDVKQSSYNNAVTLFKLHL
ncbi:TatD family hydrolase [Neptunicella marina]|uniref:TatD family hydrolase n=1 Tax=Neptunicella marina TaxID=2125989 RepID=A0A8J6IVL7_9ALTE|nr:TatD family hydrolase [Neptunicella marina]MBC3766572.1 TatD family hydrolase [Neptunicella marina]